MVFDDNSVKNHTLMIKRIIALLLILHSSIIAQNAPNLELTDLNGVTHNLYDYLDEGKSVLLDFFIVNCTPCQEGSPYLDELWETYGPNGTNQLEVISLEVYDNSDEFVEDAMNQWGVNNPVVNLDAIPDEYIPFVQGYPHYFMICPDKSMTDYLEFHYPASALFWEQSLNKCNYGDDFVDITIFEPEITHCHTNVYSSLNIGNVGTNFIDGIIVDVYIDSIYRNTIQWDHLLAPSSTTDQSFFPIVFEDNNIDGEIIEFDIYTADDINPINNSVSYNFVNDIETDQNNITIELQLDNYPSDLTWSLLDENNQVLLLEEGTNYSPYELVTTSLILDDKSCYTFIITDNVGDGICCNFGEGYYKISDGENTLFYSNDLINQNMHSFYVSELIGIEEYAEDSRILRSDFFNLNGQQITYPKIPGVYIRKDYLENGLTNSRKMVITKEL